MARNDDDLRHEGVPLASHRIQPVRQQITEAQRQAIAEVAYKVPPRSTQPMPARALAHQTQRVGLTDILARSDV